MPNSKSGTVNVTSKEESVREETPQRIEYLVGGIVIVQEVSVVTSPAGPQTG